MADGARVRSGARCLRGAQRDCLGCVSDDEKGQGDASRINYDALFLSMIMNFSKIIRLNYT